MVLSYLFFLLDENVKMFEAIVSACKIQLNDIFFERERERERKKRNKSPWNNGELVKYTASI